MESLPLLNLLELVLGKSTHKSGDNYSFYCPNCKHHKKKLEIALSPKMYKGVVYQNSYSCWTCDLQGQSIYSLFKKIDVPEEYKQQLRDILPRIYEVRERPKVKLDLPEEYQFLGDIHKMRSMDRKVGEVAIDYLKSRRVTVEQIYRYGIGICSDGTYAHRIIVPSYDKYNELNTFAARKNSDKQEKVTTYLSPENVSKDVIMFENTLDFSQPVRLVEGVFDVFASRYNTTSLSGLSIPDTLEYELLMGDCKEIYVILDSDAINQISKYLDHYKSYGKTVYFVRMDDKDPSKLGFIETSRAITSSTAYGFREKLLMLGKKKKQIRMPYV